MLVVGGGITGIYQLYLARGAGFSVQLLEAGHGVGGTWYWNRYPGARFDSESYTYAYSSHGSSSRSGSGRSTSPSNPRSSAT